MSQGLKNIFVLVSVIGLLVLAYYMFMKPDSVLTSSSEDPQTVAILAQAQLFIARRAQLEEITIDVSFFTDERFTSLQSYKTPEPDQLLGKPDLFSEPLSTDEASLSENSRAVTPSPTTPTDAE